MPQNVNLNVYKVNADIPQEIKEYIVNLSHEKIKRKRPLSAFLSLHLDDYLESALDKIPPKDMLVYFDSLPNISTNNFTFYIPKGYEEPLTRLATSNFRSLRQQAKHFVYFVYFKYKYKQVK